MTALLCILGMVAITLILPLLTKVLPIRTVRMIACAACFVAGVLFTVAIYSGH